MYVKVSVFIVYQPVFQSDDHNSVCVCVCVHACVHAGTSVYVGDHIQFVGRPEISFGNLLLCLSILFFETGSLLKLELTDSARSAGQQVPGILLYAPQPCSGVTGV